MPLFQAFTSLFGGGAQKRIDKDTFSLPTTSGSTKYDLGLVRVSSPSFLLHTDHMPAGRLTSVTLAWRPNTTPLSGCGHQARHRRGWHRSLVAEQASASNARMSLGAKPTGRLRMLAHQHSTCSRAIYSTTPS